MSAPITVQPKAWLYIAATMCFAIGLAWVVLNPVWSEYSPPFVFPKVSPPITAPVDSVFYIENAQLGYAWHTRDPLSLWFHPLLSALLTAMPSWLPLNYWLWLLSIAYGIGALLLVFRFALTIHESSSVSPRAILLCLIAPGGLGLATGNAEIPTLFFTTALLLSVLRWHNLAVTGACGVASILTKPNALYMVPILCLYLAWALRSRDKELRRQSLLGIGAILTTWFLWIGIVGWQTGHLDAYWASRELTRSYSPGNAWAFFQQMLSAFIYRGDTRDMVRFTTALVIPVANMIVLGLAPFRQERDRYAMAVGNLAMLGIALYMGNPNKIIVYTTTLPGHFAAHMMLIQRLTARLRMGPRLGDLGALALYGLYCAALLVVYVWGTPLAWYY